MGILIETIEQTIDDVCGSLSEKHKKTLIGKTLSKLSSNQLVEENKKSRELRVLSAIMDSLIEKDLEETIDQIVIDAPMDEISWDDIKEAFNGITFEKLADKVREDPVIDDEIYEAILQENPNSARYSDYGDYEKASFDESSRSYTDKSLDAEISDDQEFHIGLDKKDSLRPGNLADDAVKIQRSRSDFSTQH